MDAGDVVKAGGVPLEPLEGVVAVGNDDADGFVTQLGFGRRAGKAIGVP